MTTSHNHTKYSSPEGANKLNEMETEGKSPEISKNGRISKQKTVIFIVIGAAVVILIIVGIIIGVSSNKNVAEPGVYLEYFHETNCHQFCSNWCMNYSGVLAI